MFNKDTTELTVIDGTETSIISGVHFIGQGHAAKAYRKDDLVYLCVQWEIDNHREALAAKPSENKHIPKIIKLGYDPSWEYHIFVMPFYAKLTAKHRDAYMMFKYLDLVFIEVWGELWNSKKTAYAHNRELTSRLSKIGMHDLAEALDEFIDIVTDAGDEYKVEVQKKNMGVDKDGTLILRDMFFKPTF